jgi:hypothetical protein
MKQAHKFRVEHLIDLREKIQEGKPQELEKKATTNVQRESVCRVPLPPF